MVPEWGRIELDAMQAAFPLNKAHLTRTGKCVFSKILLILSIFLIKIERSRMSLLRGNCIEKIPLRRQPNA